MSAAKAEDTWYASERVAAPERGPLVYDLDVDVCVIGGGLAGLTSAYELARRGWSVGLLEAESLAWNASGRNGGFVGPGFAESSERIIERVGLARAKALWALSLNGVDYVRNVIRDTGMPGVNPVDGWLYAQRTDDRGKAVAEAILIGDTFATDVELWTIDQTRSVLKSASYFYGLHLPGAFHINPLNYALGLAAAAEKAGARIFEGTRAISLDPAGVRKRVETQHGRVRAAHIVLAGNVHSNGLLPRVAEAVMPITTYLAVTAPLGERLKDAITYSGGVIDMRRAGSYYRIVDGTRLMWGGRVNTDLAPAARIDRRLARDIARNYPQLGKVEITHSWSGTMGYAVHRMPQIGAIAPGLWVASAFGGHGLNTTAMAGGLIARAIIENDDTWRLFASYDLVWTGGKLGRAAAKFSYRYKRWRDDIIESLARRRDRKRRHRAALHARAREEAQRSIAAGTTRAATLYVERRAAADAARAAAEAARHLADQEEARRRAAELADRMAAARSEQLAAEATALKAAAAEREIAEETARLLTKHAHRRANAAAQLADEEADRRYEADALALAAETAEAAAAEEAVRRANTRSQRKAERALQAAADAANNVVADSEFRVVENAVRAAVQVEPGGGEGGDDFDGDERASRAARRQRRPKRATSAIPELRPPGESNDNALVDVEPRRRPRPRI